MPGPKRSIKITKHFTCTSANVIYCITCTYCKKLNIGETGRRLGERFRENLREVERNDKDTFKPVARHFNLLIILNSIWQFPAFPQIQAVRKAGKLQNKNLSFKSASFIPTVSTSAFHSTNLILFSRYHILTNSVALFSTFKNRSQSTIPLVALTRG